MYFRKISFLSSLFALSILFTSCNSKNEEKAARTPTKPTREEASKDSVLRHVVIFKFNEDASEADVEKLNLAFNALPEAIPEIKAFEWGINDSPENFHQGFTHCYLLTFDSEKDRDSIYAPHPAHKAFGDSLQPHLEKVFVVDYWTKP